MSVPEPAAATLPDLTRCATEPIHIPGRIQPHGVLLSMTEPELRVQQVSANTEPLIGVAPERLLGTALEELVGREAAADLHTFLKWEDLADANPVPLSLVVDGEQRWFDGILHRTERALVLELEPASIAGGVSFPGLYHLVRRAIARLRAAGSIAALCDIAAEEIHRITGFDRVMVYRFDPEWNGEVVAERTDPGVESFLGLRYPASDIPAQARQLYTVNWLRLIGDVGYRPVELVPPLNPATGRPLDMSFSVLRSVSPVHVEYLKNMGVGASMSVSLLRHDRLWGLIALHHLTPRQVPFAVRSACEFIGQVFSLHISYKEEQEEHAHGVRLHAAAHDLVERLREEEDPFGALARHGEDLLALTDSQGAVLLLDGRPYPVGRTPSPGAVQDLLRWLETEAAGQDLFHTDRLPVRWPGWEEEKGTTSGILFARVSGDSGVLWLRPEVIQVVNWGGNPEKPVRMEGDTLRLHPRKSFALWQETVRLRSSPWLPAETAAAAALRSALVDISLRRSEERRKKELERLNSQLEQSNQELDAFAYSASHDLKEPLRGIQNYARFMLEDYGPRLEEEGRERLETIVRLSNRMQGFIDALLHFSRVGRVELAYREVNVNDLVREVLEMLRYPLEEAGLEVRLPRPLPVVWCDSIRVGEVFNNLIGNAAKYNDKERKWVEVGYFEPADAAAPSPAGEAGVPVFYVRDNGIGIRERNLEAIFSMFQRLHGRDKFGGGTGAGLTIARRIVERHGGRMWVESRLGEGTTFYFTLSGSK